MTVLTPTPTPTPTFPPAAAAWAAGVRSLPCARQRGISLLIVMVLVLVGSFAVLGALRYGILGEASVGNEADFQRARAAADALIEDALIDILGYLPPNNALCNPLEESGGCRTSSKTFAIPLTWDDLDVLEEGIIKQTGYDAMYPCLIAGIAPLASANNRRIDQPGGLCVTSSVPIGGSGAEANWWDTQTVFAAMLQRGTPFGGATGRRPDPNDAILSDPARARYWIEAIRYANRLSEPTQPGFELKSQRVIYRVTAYAQGVRGGRVVIQSSLFHPDSRK